MSLILADFWRAALSVAVALIGHSPNRDTSWHVPDVETMSIHTKE